MIYFASFQILRVFVLASVVLAAIGAQPRPDDLVSLARDGWRSARAAAQYGGAPPHLAEANRILAAIDKMTVGTIWHVHGAYAHSLIAAAMAAAQDENAEMDLHLVHARSLADRLTTSAYPAQWPCEIDEAEGELWLEVDRYADALRAFRRAVEHGTSHRAVWLGLARSAARAGETAVACGGYRRVAQMPDDASPDTARTEASEYLKRCP
jgi:hypothetical protein